MGQNEPPALAQAGDAQGQPARIRYLDTLRAEIRLLARTVADDPNKQLSDLKVLWGGKTLDYAETVEQLAKDDEGLSGPEQLRRLGLFQAIKDALVLKTTPATSLTIAYTTMVVGEQQSDEAESVHALSRQVFGNLRLGARRYAWFVRGLAVVTLLMTGLAAWESTKASVGKNLLQTLEPLRSQQATLSADRFKLEMALEKSSGAGPTELDGLKRRLPVCLRYLVNEPSVTLAGSFQQLADIGVRQHDGPEIRELCGRDEILAHNFDVAHVGIQNFMYFWPDLAGGLYAVVGHAMATVHDTIGRGPSWRKSPTLSFEPQACADTRTSQVNQATGVPNPVENRLRCGDIEYLAAPVVKVISDFTLPFLFGVIGSMLYVLLQHYANVRANTLRPIHEALAYLRVILGIVVAACVSLFITSYASPPIQTAAGGSFGPNSLVNSLSLSASGVTFLAGFGAEAVFTLLQQLVDRVFALPKQ